MPILHVLLSAQNLKDLQRRELSKIVQLISKRKIHSAQIVFTGAQPANVNLSTGGKHHFKLSATIEQVYESALIVDSLILGGEDLGLLNHNYMDPGRQR